MTESVLYKIVRARIAGIFVSFEQNAAAGRRRRKGRGASARESCGTLHREDKQEPEAMARRYQTPRGERLGARSEADALENGDDAPARAIAHRSSSGNSRGSPLSLPPFLPAELDYSGDPLRDVRTVSAIIESLHVARGECLREQSINRYANKGEERGGGLSGLGRAAGWIFSTFRWRILLRALVKPPSAPPRACVAGRLSAGMRGRFARAIKRPRPATWTYGDA